ncbi:hypothetical protein KCP77_06395 [Salmonella enterica subsp. enterica]|nr:hypothetical protein KCP77_06395 [Salmonella enterica subsp. enterica]
MTFHSCLPADTQRPGVIGMGLGVSRVMYWHYRLLYTGLAAANVNNTGTSG